VGDETLGRAVLALTTDDAGIGRGLSKAERDVKGWSSRISGSMLGMVGIGAGIGGAIAAVSGFLADSVKEAAAADRIMAQLNATLTSTGGASGQTSASITRLSDSLAVLSGVEDDAITSAQSMLLTFTSVGGSTFPQATQAILDMATAMNGGAIPAEEQLRQTTILVGKALNDPITGLTALRRVGVAFSESQKDAIKTMMEMNDVAGAQAIILQELSKEFGGSAAAAGQSFAGRMQIATNEVNNFKEAVGGSALPLLTQFADALAKIARSAREVLTDAEGAAQIQALQNAVGMLEVSTNNLAEAENWLNQARAAGMDTSAAQAAVDLATARRDAAVAALDGINAAHAEEGALKKVAGAAGEASEGIDDFNAANKSLVRAGGMIADTLERQKDQLAALLALREREKFLGRAMPTGPNLDWMGVIQNMPQPRFDDAPTEEEQAAVMARVLAGQETIAANGKRLNTSVAGDYSQKMSAAVNLVSGYLGTAMDDVKRLMGDALGAAGGGMKPGENGPFENIFRAADVAVNGAKSPWAEKLGLTQEAAMQIVKDFTSGAMTGAVQALINVPALIQAAKTAQTAAALKDKFVADIAAAAGTGTSVVEALFGAAGGSTGDKKAAIVGADKTATAIVGGVKGALDTIVKDVQAIGSTFMDNIIAGMKLQQQAMIDYWATVMKTLAAMMPTLPSLTPGGATPPTGPAGPTGVNSMTGLGAMTAATAAAGSGNRSYQNTFNVTIHAPGGDANQVRRAAEQGVLSAARAMGMR
jgi:hypothetical protein